MMVSFLLGLYFINVPTLCRLIIILDNNELQVTYSFVTSIGSPSRTSLGQIIFP